MPKSKVTRLFHPAFVATPSFSVRSDGNQPKEAIFFSFLCHKFIIWFLSNFVYLPVITSFTYHILNLGIRLGFIFFILFCVYTVVNWSFNFESLYIINIDKVGKRDVWSRTFPPNSHMTFVYIWNWIHFVNSEYCVYTSEAFDKAFYRYVDITKLLNLFKVLIFT